jgi:hypothetical protein
MCNQSLSKQGPSPPNDISRGGREREEREGLLISPAHLPLYIKEEGEKDGEIRFDGDLKSSQNQP